MPLILNLCYAGSLDVRVFTNQDMKWPDCCVFFTTNICVPLHSWETESIQI